MAAIYEELCNELKFAYCRINKDYVEIEKIDGVKLEDYNGIWHIQYAVQYSSEETSVLENGSFYK